MTEIHAMQHTFQPKIQVSVQPNSCLDFLLTNDEQPIECIKVFERNGSGDHYIISTVLPLPSLGSLRLPRLNVGKLTWIVCSVFLERWIDQYL